jgi:hypothetical protein
MDSAGEHRRRRVAPADRRERQGDERERQGDERERQGDERDKHPDELAQELGVPAVSREPPQTWQPRDNDAAEPSRSEWQSWRSQEAQIPPTVRVTMTLMETTASTERDIARTLQDMAAQDEGEAAARRRRLAEEAIQGARDADKRTEQLQQLARQWAEHAEVVTLHQLLAHAAQVLTDLARTEQGIADSFTSLASQDGSALAAQRRELAAAATAEARNARDRARDLRQLARTSAAGGRHQ